MTKLLPVLLAAAFAAAAPSGKSPARPAKKPAVMPAPAARAPARLVMRGPLDLTLLQREKRAVVTHSRLAGSLEQVLDGNRNTAARLEPSGQTAFFQVVLDRPRPLEEINVLFAGAEHHWTLTAADSVADLEAKRGSYRVLVPHRTAPPDRVDQEGWKGAPPLRVYRLECRRAAGEGEVALAEWSLWCPQELAAVAVETFAPNVARGELLQLRAEGRFEAGAGANLTPEAEWEVSPPERARVDTLGRLEGIEPGPVQVVAVHNGLRSAPTTIDVLAAGQPDWVVTHIERHPRLDSTNLHKGFTPGQTVYWFAHVKNYGTGVADPVRVEWRVDGKTVSAGRLPKLDRFALTELILSTKWDGKRREVELAVDPQGEAAETSETNNSVKVYSDALAVGFWVEDSVVRYFHRHQKELGIGSNSWEDWAQRQVAHWNRWMEASGWLCATPEDAAVRYRLDRIVIVGDGMLPMAAGSPRSDPDRRDDSLHWMWGFPARDLAEGGPYARTTEKSAANPFYYQASLLHVLAPERPEPPRMGAR